MNSKIRDLLNGKGENYILPFFWQHGEDEATLRKYMDVIQRSNIGAVCVESRPHPDFCGPQWWHDMDIILDEARRRGMRVFGKGKGSKPAQAEATTQRTGDLNALIRWKKVENAQGYNIRYGVHPDKLYLSWLVYDKTELDLSTLNQGSLYFVCVDSFNENGITQGKTIEVSSKMGE